MIHYFSRRISGFIVILLLSASLAGPHQAQAAQDIRQVDPVEVMSLLVQTTMLSLDFWWTMWFFDRGLMEPMVTYTMLGAEEVVVTNCGPNGPTRFSGADKNAVYCDADVGYINGVEQRGVILLPLVPLLQVFQGDMLGRGWIDANSPTVIAIIAHEFSHHVTFELHSQTGIPLPGPPNLELVADCLSGSFLLWYDQTAQLSESEIQAVLGGLALIADKNGGIVTHGTATQRQQAFLIGFNHSRGPDTRFDCFETYWPATVA